MHYYPHHIGDFIRDTARLSDAQCMAYLRLIWTYYDTEKPLTDDPDALAFQIGSTADVVRQILAHYFQKTDEGWRHTRCDAVINDYHGKQDKARRSANARWKDANAMRTHTERNANAPKNDANQEPITKNQEPIKEKTPRKRVAPPDGVSDRVWEDFLDLRKVRKAPMTEAALDGIRREAEKAGWSLEDALRESCARGWQGFKADWVADKPKPVTFAQQAADVARATVPAKQGTDPALQKIIEDRMKAVPPPANVREKLAALRGGS